LLAVAFGRHGHRVELLIASGREIGVLNPEWTHIYESVGVDVRVLDRIPGTRPDYLAPTLEVFHALRERPPDVVVADDWRGLGWAAMRSRQLGLTLTKTAFIVHCHGPGRVLAAFAQKVPDTLARFGEEVTERASLELADAVVSPTEWLLDWLRAHEWPVPESASVIPYVRQGVALDETPEPPATAEQVRRVAFFGQLREGKGIRIFLTALDRLESDVLRGVEVIFLGSESNRWTSDRILSALSTEVRERVAGIRFETQLPREAALAELRRPGTLAVMPSLLDNSPNTVLECIDHGIPFVATDTGGIPELVAAEDHDRVLCAPTTDDLVEAMTRALASRDGFAPARPAHEPHQSLEAWLALVDRVEPSPTPNARAPTQVAIVATGEASAARAHRLAQHTHSVVVEVVQAVSRRAGFERTAAEWIVFLDDDDAPEDDLLDTLVAAQKASDADLVTAAVRPSDEPEGIQLFLGDPGALGLLENQYGVLGLLRSELAAADPLPDAAVDPDWPLFARVALGGARVVSIPEPLSVHSRRPGRVGDIPGEGLAVLEAFEASAGAKQDGLPQLAATLAASYAHVARPSPSEAARPSLVDRTVRVIRAEGVAGAFRRARGRLSRDRGPVL
jgi:glycosyltransferase involved in cell wall biosynthesis